MRLESTTIRTSTLEGLLLTDDKDGLRIKTLDADLCGDSCICFNELTQITKTPKGQIAFLSAAGLPPLGVPDEKIPDELVAISWWFNGKENLHPVFQGHMNTLHATGGHGERTWFEGGVMGLPNRLGPVHSRYISAPEKLLPLLKESNYKGHVMILGTTDGHGVMGIPGFPTEMFAFYIEMLKPTRSFRRLIRCINEEKTFYLNTRSPMAAFARIAFPPYPSISFQSEPVHYSVPEGTFGVIPGWASDGRAGYVVGTGITRWRSRKELYKRIEAVSEACGQYKKKLFYRTDIGKRSDSHN